MTSLTTMISTILWTASAADALWCSCAPQSRIQPHIVRYLYYQNAPMHTILTKQEAMPPKAWLPVFEPGAGWQRLRGMQGEAPCPVSRGGALWAGCRVTTPAQSPEAERSGPRHFAGFRRKTESVIVGSYTFAESAVPPSPRAPNETHHTTKERLTIKSQAEMRGKVRKI